MIKKLCLFLISLVLFGSFAVATIAGPPSEIEERERAIKEALFVASCAKEKVLKIGLVDCIAYALTNNSEIRIEKIEPMIAKQEVKIAEAEFAPTFSFEGALEDEKVEAASSLAGSHARTGKFNFGIDGRLPLGTEYDIEFLNKKYKDNSAYLSTNPYYKSEALITITQPLFEDFGILVNRADIIIAKNNLEKSNQNLKKELIEVISKVKQAYYNYVLEIEKYKTAQISLQRAEDLLGIVQKRKERGLASSIDLLEANTGVAEREDALLTVEKSLKLAEDNLKYETNLINDPEFWHAHIEPLDKPELKEEPVDLMESLKQAFEYRPDYEAAKIELNNQNIRIRVKENATLPTIDLVGSLGANGLAEDYQGALKADYKEWSTGVKVSFPWGNQEAQGNYEKANLTKKQLLISFERLQQKIILEVRDGVRGIDTAQKKVAATKKRMETETARYEAVKQRFREGLISAHDMLEYQEDLSNAETSFIQALIDYAQSLINLDKQMGVTLAKSDIKLEE